MMIRSSHSRVFIALALPAIMLTGLIFLMSSKALENTAALGTAITIDLLLIVPLVYFLLIRKTSVPNTTVVPMIILGLLIGSTFLPAEHQTGLELFKTYGLPLVELTVLGYIIFTVRKAVRRYRSLENTTTDFFTAVQETCRSILPKPLVMPFATEVSVIYYGFILWKKPTLKANEFTYHRNSSAPALMGALIMVIVIEAVALHFLIAMWSDIAAWILTGLSVYTAVQVFAFARSLSKRPIIITDEGITLHFGILSEATIPFEDIDRIEQTERSLEKDALTRKLSPLGELTSHNMVIDMKSEHFLAGPYGIRKKFKTIAFQVDEPETFRAAIEVHSTR